MEIGKMTEINPGHGAPKEDKGAVVAVIEGTTSPECDEFVNKYVSKMKETYPDVEFRLAVTSDVIRKVLAEQGERKSSVLGALAGLIDDGYSQIVVQPLYITPGNALHSIYPVVSGINKLVGPHGMLDIGGVLISNPLLLKAEDYRNVADALASIFNDGTVVLVASNEEGNADPTLCQLQMVLDEITGGRIVIAANNGYPGIEQVKNRLAHINAEKVTLAPFTIVANYHAKKDVYGDKESSWKNVLEAAGHDVRVDERVLGKEDAILDLFVEQLKQTAKSHNFL
jgi:sirohydrochlorin cobaltochelatase